ncbi:PVC-type heme-binding CxxCH protein [Verrucomicrobiales bacterium BCK34]|nr:PVC-type heme-binding CxxCH protein [Verrucomicrobiales bacterium BCK34]
MKPPPRLTAFFLGVFFLLPLASKAESEVSAIRVLFVGHQSEQHPSDLYYPIIQKALGREAIYFDYVTSTADAFGSKDYLSKFDTVLLYANHKTIELDEWTNLKTFIEDGGGFVPVHCASWCFQNIPEYDQLVGGRFANHKTGIFRAKTIAPDHTAISNVPEFEAWDETYVHTRHNPENRTVLQIREVAEEDNITEPEPWTWVRTQGKGRVFYTASGHDERVWNEPAFHKLIKKGILWSVGEKRRAGYEAFIQKRTPLNYEKTDNIPNYEKRPEPLPKQDPLSAGDSMTYTRVPVDFRLELFASEPRIVNPISLAWDERGRLWVAETVDYPNDVRDGSGDDTIKILEDTDGDGRCDKVTVFAEGLNIPTSLVCYGGGVIVAQAPDFLFLKDTDGDDKADLKEVLFSGWGIQDTHAGPSNLRYGHDNWIYGAVGYSGFEGEIGDEAHRFASGIYRFRPDGSKLEFLYQFNNNTWGLGLSDTGEVFGSTANNNPSFHGILPATIYREGTKGLSAEMIANSATFHPITPNIRQVDVFGGYTAGAGHALATSANFPPSFRNRAAFIAGPTGNLLGRFDLKKKEHHYTATNAYPFLASADEWFSPVAAEVGPDGNLWIADWYNFIIQHNPTPSAERGGYEGVKGKGNAHENPNRDRQHGRIYRAIWDGAQLSTITSLEGADSDRLVAALGHDNQFWRMAAQRLLVTGKITAAATKLRALVNGESTITAIHALWTLEGLGELDRASHQLALLSKDPDIQRNAIRALGSDSTAQQLFFDTAAVTSDDLSIRLAAFIKLAGFPKNETVALAVGQLLKDRQNRSDEILSTALKAAAQNQGINGPATYGPNLLSNTSFEKITGPERLPVGWTVRTYQGSARHLVDFKEAKTGNRSLKIYTREGADTSMFTKVKVSPKTDYRLSGWVKTSGIAGARGAQLNVHEIQNPRPARTRGLRKRNDWTLLEVEFNTGDRNEITINCLYGGWGTSTGTAWFDDIALQEISYPETGDSGAKLSGDPDRGLTLFNNHQVAACIRCHKVAGKGEGIIGPALDGIATRKSYEYIYESLVDPGARLAEGFPAQVSPMPPMGVLLKPQELADVMAYLMTLTE